MQRKLTRRFILQKARGHAFPDRSRDIALPLLVGIRFQVLFHSPPGVLFTFPSRYWFAIGRRGYLALGDGPPGFPQGFSCPVVLGSPAKESSAFRLQGFHPLWPAFPCRSAKQRICNSSASSAVLAHKIPQRPCRNACRLSTRHGFGLFPVRSPLLGESLLFSVPPGTKMFQFPGCPPHPRFLGTWVIRHYADRVSPFGYLRIKACLQLPEAFRR